MRMRERLTKTSAGDVDCLQNHHSRTVMCAKLGVFRGLIQKFTGHNMSKVVLNPSTNMANGRASEPTRATARSVVAITATYVGALLGVAFAVFVADWLQPLLDPSVVLLVSVVIVAWFGGFWQAMFASALATLALDYFFTAPFHTLRFDFVHIPRLAVFTATAGLFTSVSARRRRAE